MAGESVVRLRVKHLAVGTAGEAQPPKRAVPERMRVTMEMDLKCCRRTDLIELINTQRRTIEMLKSENADLRQALSQAQDGAPADEPPAPSEAAEPRPAETVCPAEPAAAEQGADSAADPADPTTAAALTEVLRRLDGMQTEDARRVHELERENAELRARLEQTQTVCGETGNLAEAALSVSGVFESAQRAAEKYLADVKSARGDADAILATAHEKAAQIERDAQDKATAREQAADESIRAKEEEFQKRCSCVISSYEALRKIMG